MLLITTCAQVMSTAPNRRVWSSGNCTHSIELCFHRYWNEQWTVNICLHTSPKPITIQLAIACVYAHTRRATHWSQPQCFLAILASKREEDAVRKKWIKSEKYKTLTHFHTHTDAALVLPKAEPQSHTNQKRYKSEMVIYNRRTVLLFASETVCFHCASLLSISFDSLLFGCLPYFISVCRSYQWYT